MCLEIIMIDNYRSYNFVTVYEINLTLKNFKLLLYTYRQYSGTPHKGHP